MKSVFQSGMWKNIALGVALSSALSVPVMAEESQTEEATPSVKSLPLDELRLFTEVFQRIKSAYVEPVDDAVLLEDALRGMIAGLDPHSAYLEPSEFENLQAHTSGEFGGLGIEVGLEDGFVRVITPIDDTPAQRAGVKAGDLITKLDEHPVQGMGLNEAVELMRGKPGSKIILTIVREGEEKPLEIEVVRDVIQVASVKSRMLDENYGYLRVSQFQVDSGKEVNKHLKRLLENDLRGVVLDLRNNPGGVLQAAVDISDAFINEGLIVYTKGRLQESEQRFSATNTTLVPDLPMVVLINGGSASASEIVAGALQDQKRAIIMGQESFGKGSVQTVLPLTKERALKLTTARYYTPNGRSIQAQGIKPDIEVRDAEITLRDDGQEFLKEKDLSGHLDNGAGKTKSSSDRKSNLAERDYQLYEALNLLKALVIVKKG
ncbi:S41 family peptidase [Neptuniibacter caesariensis]|uniref:Carboxyl-terminal protease n=1 Tax=Neptuniibacter caesariensis TaxID=207954 RepID=A0A7U8GRB7_NEPCE|nr:S41 family peptidase [Neptuniibacter caesariensis]EAR60037.1 carboxyl-terminal protease [Neptuniibacter caesariensis]